MKVLMIDNTQSIIIQNIKEKLNNYTIDIQSAFEYNNEYYDFIFSTQAIGIKTFFTKSTILKFSSSLKI